MRIKQNFDDYLSEERNEYGYRELKNDAPDDVKREYEEYMKDITDAINNNQPIAK